MSHSTTNTYTLKREILSFSSKISSGFPKDDRKFAADMSYGILASGSCLLTDITDHLHEPAKKVNSVERLSRHLASGIPEGMQANYLLSLKKMIPSSPVIHIDDSDVVKPEGKHFEFLGYVRDDSASTKEKNVFQKGYHVTEACALTYSGQPVSLFSEIHSSSEKQFSSINNITFSAIDRVVQLFGKATFAMDRGYDDNKIFHKLLDAGQDFVIRLTAKRKAFYHGKWIPVTELRSRRKGKVKLPLFYKGKEHEAYLSHVKIQITADKRPVNLVLVYGITEHPMMLATNRTISSKEDVILVARTYFSRWRIEEYFRSKKQLFQFENFRVRKLASINALNFFLSVCMAFLAHLSMKSDTNALKVAIIQTAAPIKASVQFHFYRIAKGVAAILAYAKEGVRLWFKTKRPKYRQLRFRFAY